jgi:phage-related holin
MKELLERLVNNLQELSTAVALKGAFAAVCGWLLDTVGYPQTAVLSLAYLLLADLGLGSTRAWMQRMFRGRRLLAGALKFGLYFCAVALFMKADQTLAKVIDLKSIGIFDASLSDVFIAYLALNELGSCMEHLVFFGLPMPEGLKERLQKYREVLTRGSV